MVAIRGASGGGQGDFGSVGLKATPSVEADDRSSLRENTPGFQRPYSPKSSRVDLRGTQRRIPWCGVWIKEIAPDVAKVALGPGSGSRLGILAVLLLDPATSLRNSSVASSSSRSI